LAPDFRFVKYGVSLKVFPGTNSCSIGAEFAVAKIKFLRFAPKERAHVFLAICQTNTEV
jgi:hypothetical protein